MAKISVIIPVYNSSKYLKECLDSVFNQTYKDFEVIAINDASTDDSLSILLEYRINHGNMQILNNNVNQGAGKSRNMGIDIAKGEYLMFVDSDDYILPNTLEDAYRCAVNNSSDLVRYDLNRLKGKKEFDFKVLDPSFQGREKHIELGTNDYIFKENAGPCNKLFSRKLIGDTRFAEGIIFEDTPFTMSNVFNAENIYYLKETLYKYRFNPESTMGNNLFHVNPRILDIFTSMDLIKQYVPDREDLDEYIRSIQLINCVHIFNDLILWKELSLKEKQMLYSYAMKLILLKYGDIQSDYAYNLTKENDAFFRNRMKFMNKFFVKDEFMQSDNEDDLMKKSYELINK